MLNHVFLGTNDVEKSRAFYNATMDALGVAPAGEYPHLTVYANEGGAVAVGKPANGEAASVSNGATLGLKASSYDQVNAWHAAGLANGGSDEGAPGVRENAPGQMYGAYLRDPDGNKICAFCPNENA
ncbi:VOC family protein [Alteraurantiacibacter aquimixticola]|uniref:VOC family protein n=1 Tax=Alteraurantiacibacter aquimixticola TaxID=2489173 RepID=A0A4T3EXX2_9SPHN|nr:VOC family protein [Alteraurantiacibacter aquimixticola]TIX49498.1 VOC family protein [Alteraurantiacibacter aquimixticola]